MLYRILLRDRTAAEWTAIDEVLNKGEMGVELDTNKFKFGDGSSKWSELSYVVAVPSTPGVTDHAALTHLAYADAAHTGFAPTVHTHQTPWPVLTTTQMNALTPTEGSVCWNTTEHQLYVYDGSAWVGVPMQA